ncbi:MAG: hypothetical protein ACREK5_01290 [Gemmatimonadota bacterium]
MAEKTRTRKLRSAEKPRRSTAAKPTSPTLSFSRANAYLLGAAAGTIGLGYVLLAQGSMNLAPIFLVLGYCVLLPIGIIKK